MIFHYTTFDNSSIESPINQHDWVEAGTHSKKRLLEFSQPVFKETMAIVEIEEGSIEKIERIFRKAVKYYDSSGK